MSAKSLQESLGKLLEISYKGYAEEQAGLLTALDTLVNASSKFNDQKQYDKALALSNETIAKVRGTANMQVAKAYTSALEDQYLNYQSDKEISQSINESEMAMMNLMDEYKTSEMQDILASLYQVAADYRGQANDATMGKLSKQIKRAHDIADLAEEFKRYDTEATVTHKEYVPIDPEGKTGIDEEGQTSVEQREYITGEGIQLTDSGMIKAYNKLSRLDLKGASTAFAEAEKQYIDDTWSDNGRALSSVLTRANNALGDALKKDEYQGLPTAGLADLDEVLLEQTRENIINEIGNFITVKGGLGGFGALQDAYNNNGIAGLEERLRMQMEAKSIEDKSFAKKTDYQKIKDLTKGFNLRTGGEKETDHAALAGLLESLFEVNQVGKNIAEVLNIDTF